jgi:hypothetical protein
MLTIMNMLQACTADSLQENDAEGGGSVKDPSSLKTTLKEYYEWLWTSYHDNSDFGVLNLR